MNYRIYTLLFVLLSNITIYAQAPSWQWAQKAGADKWDNGTAIATDINRNVYVTGYFMSISITFGNITLTNADTTGSTSDIFVVKYDASGNVLWAKRAGGNDYENSNAIAVDDNGNCYITGSFEDVTLVFDTITLTNALSTSDKQDVFVVKYNASGNVVWAKSAGGTGHDSGSGIATDKFGNCYVTGSFSSPTMSMGNTSVGSSGADDIFMARYNASGNVVWAKSIGGAGYDFGNAIAVDASGNCYITGAFGSGTLVVGSSTIYNAGSFHIFVAKYNIAGNFIWARGAGGTSEDFGNSIAVDSIGNSYVTGYFGSASLSFGTFPLTNNGYYADIFLTKYDPSGTVLWAKSVASSGADYGNGIAVDTSGNSYLVAVFGGSVVSVGGISLTNTSSDDDFFIAKYSSSGNVAWAKSAGGNDNDMGKSIAVDVDGNACITGYYRSTNITFGNTAFSSAGNADFFVAKMGGITTAVEEKQVIENRISIFPNPSTGQIKIISDQDIDEIKITNLLGQVIYYSKSNEKEFLVELDKAGIYFITLTSDKQNITQKLIVNK